jgi:hypothetical protein
VSDELHIGPPPQDQSSSPRLLLLAGAATALIVGLVLFWPRSVHREAPAGFETHLAFGAREQAYAPRVEIRNVQLSRAENMLHQEVTTISAEIFNGGDQPIRDVELTLEFFDQMNQVVLRESRRVRPAARAALPPRTAEPFEIAVEHISTMWNMQAPVFRVTGILFAEQ